MGCLFLFCDFFNRGGGLISFSFSPLALHLILSACAKTRAASFKISSSDKSVGGSLRKCCVSGG